MKGVGDIGPPPSLARGRSETLDHPPPLARGRRRETNPNHPYIFLPPFVIRRYYIDEHYLESPTTIHLLPVRVAHFAECAKHSRGERPQPQPRSSHDSFLSLSTGPAANSTAVVYDVCLIPDFQDPTPSFQAGPQTSQVWVRFRLAV